MPLPGGVTTVPPRAYVTLDNPLLLALAREESALFLQRFPPPVLIDEIQYAPGLLPLIKERVDADGGRTLLANRLAAVSSDAERQRIAGGTRGGDAPAATIDGRKSRPWGGDGPLPARRDALAWVFGHIWRGSFPALHGGKAPDRERIHSVGASEVTFKVPDAQYFCPADAPP